MQITSFLGRHLIIKSVGETLKKHQRSRREVQKTRLPTGLTQKVLTRCLWIWTYLGEAGPGGEWPPWAPEPPGAPHQSGAPGSGAASAPAAREQEGPQEAGGAPPSEGGPRGADRPTGGVTEPRRPEADLQAALGDGRALRRRHPWGPTGGLRGTWRPRHQPRGAAPGRRLPGGPPCRPGAGGGHPGETCGKGARGRQAGTTIPGGGAPKGGEIARRNG